MLCDKPSKSQLLFYTSNATCFKKDLRVGDVLLVGEFGRTPKISKGAKRIGRDHWPNCYSAMLAGAGIQGGSLYGESDKQAAYVKSNPVTLEDFTATLFAAMGINPASRLSRDGFTLPASTGNPIQALL